MLNHDVKQFRSDKILKHVDRINDWVNGGNPPPITMEIDMTNVCTHGCPECVVNYFRIGNRDALPREVAERIIREMAEYGVRGLIFTGGGDPLCHRDTPAMIELAGQCGLDVALITNASLLNEETMRIALEHCVWMRISIDAASPEVFQEMHGLPEIAYNKVIENTKRLVELKKETGSKTTIGIGYLTCGATKPGMVEMARTCGEWGVDYLQFRPLQIHHGGEFQYDWVDVDEEIEQAVKYSTNDYKVLYSQHKYQSIKRRDYGRDYCKCYGQQFASTIAANGKMYICCHTRDFEKYCLGDLHTQSFKEIWESEQRQQAIANIDFKDCIPLCRDNTFNQILWQIKQPRVHENFL